MTNDKQPDVREAGRRSMQESFEASEYYFRGESPAKRAENWHIWKDAYQAALQSPSVANEGWKPTQLEVLAWNDRNGGWFQGRLDEARCAIDDARSMHLIAASPQPPQQQEQRCPYCDNSGDVHRADGEWLGECTHCKQQEQSGEAVAKVAHPSPPTTCRRLGS